MNQIFLIVVFGIAAYGLFLWARVLRDRPPLLTHPTPFGLVDVLILFSGWVVLPSIVVAGMLGVWKVDDPSNLSSSQTLWLMGTTTALQLVVSFLITFVFLLRYGSLQRVLGVNANWDGIAKHCKVAFGMFAMVVPALLGLQTLLSHLVPYEHGTINQLQDNFSLTTALVAWSGAVIAAPICEELFFRGVLQGWLQRVRLDARLNGNNFNEFTGGWSSDSSSKSSDSAPLESLANVNDAVDAESSEHLSQKINLDDTNPFAVTTADTSESQGPTGDTGDNDSVNAIAWWLPIIISSGLFAAVHIGQGLAPVVLFLFGLALGYLFRQTGSIVPPIILHFLLNGFSMFWLTVDLVLNSPN